MASRNALSMRILLATSLLPVLAPVDSIAQPTDLTTDQAAPAIIEISDEPRTIDPATLVPDALAAKVTVEIDGVSIREVVDWLNENCELPVVIDERSFVDAGLSLNETVSDKLNNQPLYLLLNHLRTAKLEWHIDDEILHISVADQGDRQMDTRSYNVGDLLDVGHDWDSLLNTIESAVSPDSWDSVGGKGVLEMLGDVLFIRQSERQHMEVEGVLAALGKHGRQTFTSDPVEHVAIREKLSTKISVAFEDTPLEEAIAELAQLADIDIRLDARSLREQRVRGREPVSLEISDRSAKTILDVLLSQLKLDWILRDAVVWVTTEDSAAQVLKTAIYDVRDLCRNKSESESLTDAIISQMHPDTWSDVGGDGEIAFPLPGVMVVRTQETIHDDVFDLLQKYRTALKSSKRRAAYVDPETEVVTHYYKLYTPAAISIEGFIQQTIQPDTWRSENKPDAPGTIRFVTSSPITVEGGEAIEQSVLVIRHTRSVHRKIARLVEKILHGAPYSDAAAGMGGGMGGSFGGGMFDVPSDALDIKR